ncbi:hypothetical protein [Corynebacterium sp. H113]|uniref:hypothetical protein n=1 Tax=Corynebacterium sp. H113 TaxID=3133419 RepID=UPI003099858C
MSISMHIDEYMARRGITPDDTIVNDDPCAIFDGTVVSPDDESVSGESLATEEHAVSKDSRSRIEEAEAVIRDILE